MAPKTHILEANDVSKTSHVFSDNDMNERLEKANAIVRGNVLWALGVGLVPIPLADILGLVAVEAKMLKQLSNLYGVKYSESAGKKAVLALLTAIGSTGVGVALASTLFKLIPIVGTSLGVISMPVVAGAATMAIGRVFITHFETGGTVLNFDAKAMRNHFRAEFERAKEIVTDMKKEEVVTTPPPAAVPPATASARAR